MKHHKHPPIKRPRSGKYAKTEFALVGTTCERMEGLMSQLQDRLDCKTLLVTGDHDRSKTNSQRRYATKVFTADESWNAYDDRLLGNQYDLVLVNGNHYPANRQIVFLDPAKAGTLERRKDQLTNVVAVVTDAIDEAPAWLRDRLPELPPVWSTASVYERLQALLEAAVEENRPTVRALILTGGKSVRMGEDKAGLVYQNGVPEAERLANICREQGLEVYFSVSTAGEAADEVPDRFTGLGALGAIASAFLYDPESAWLVLACDLPLLDRKTIENLLAARDGSQLATAVRGASQRFPEPLVTIYEPRAYARMLQFLGIGYACPRKVLINSSVKEVVLEDESPITNANTPEERRRILATLAG